MSLLLVIILAALSWLAFHDWQLPNALRYRPFQGRVWRSSFPSASRKDIREFLSVFGAAFSFGDSKPGKRDRRAGKGRRQTAGKPQVE